MRSTLFRSGTLSLCCATLALLAIPTRLQADGLTLPHTFQNGDVADANQVNDNFAAVKGAVDAEAAQIAALTSRQLSVTTLFDGKGADSDHGW